MASNDETENHFRYVVMAARRARQLQNGSQPLVDSPSTKACRVAQDEIAAGKVKAASAMVEPIDLSPDIQQDPEV
jgi:DNA-directed RNA polymerase subunit omega